MIGPNDAPQVAIDIRWNVCKECEHLHKVTKFCGVCKCFMPLKVRIKDEKCPIGKWGVPKPRQPVDTNKNL